MGIFNNMKEKIKGEINAIKYNRQLENDPDIIRNKKDSLLAQVKSEKIDLERKQIIEKERRELATLKNSVGFRGQISGGLTKIKTHLDTVKAKNEANNKGKGFNIKATNSGIQNNPGAFEIRGAGKSIMEDNPKGPGGVFSVGSKSEVPGIKKKKKSNSSKTIIIKI